MIHGYDLDWRPLPVIQDYATWTEDLDKLNAEAIRSDEAPERLLLTGPNTTLGEPHIGGWQSPRTYLEILCRYRLLAVSDTTPEAGVARASLGPSENRCGPLRDAGSQEAAFGEPVQVPAPRSNELVFVGVWNSEPRGLERVREFLYRPRERRVILDGSRNYRFVPRLGHGPLLVQAAAGTDLPRPFSFSPQAHELAVVVNGDQPDHTLLYRFYRMRLPRRVTARSLADQADPRAAARAGRRPRPGPARGRRSRPGAPSCSARRTRSRRARVSGSGTRPRSPARSARAALRPRLGGGADQEGASGSRGAFLAALHPQRDRTGTLTAGVAEIGEKAGPPRRGLGLFRGRWPGLGRVVTWARSPAADPPALGAAAAAGCRPGACRPRASTPRRPVARGRGGRRRPPRTTPP